MPQNIEIYIRKMRFDEAKRRLLAEIEHHFFEGHRDITVIHGIGNYILRKMAIEELSKLDYVRIEDNAFNPNPGSLKITLLVPDDALLEKYK